MWRCKAARYVLPHHCLLFTTVIYIWYVLSTQYRYLHSDSVLPDLCALRRPTVSLTSILHFEALYEACPGCNLNFASKNNVCFLSFPSVHQLTFMVAYTFVSAAGMCPSCSLTTFLLMRTMRTLEPGPCFGRYHGNEPEKRVFRVEWIRLD